jgi:hypothetical protein
MNDVASSLATIRETPDYQQIKDRLGDREWRLDSLYWIRDKNGLPIPFKRNEAQRQYSSREWFRDTILKSRQLGFSTFIAIEILDQCLFSSNNTADIIDRTASDAEKKLAILRFAYDRLPPIVKSMVGLTKDNQSEIKFTNGSSVGAGTSSRGGTPNQLHISEYGPISADNPRKAKEIKVGSFAAVPKNGKIWVESTAKGTSGEFYDLVKAGEQLQATGQKLTNLDFKLHFFPWYLDPANRLPVNLVNITQELREYFDELRVKYGVILDGLQEAWYTKTREFYGVDDVKSEHPSTADECFFASLEGAYFKNEMNAARRDRRIGFPVPHDPTRPVHTSTDLGLDENLAIVFFQTDGVRHRFIDFARGEHSGLMDFIRIIKEKNANRGFSYGKHYAAHDIKQRDWSNMTGVTAQTRMEVAADHGVQFIPVDRVSDKQDSIEAGRRFIGQGYFCSEYASGLVECLDNYTKSWNRATQQWSPAPAKNGFDHGADAFQGAAMGLQPDTVKRRDQFRGKPKGSQWSA